MRFQLDVDGESHAIEVLTRKGRTVVEVDGVPCPMAVREVPGAMEVRMRRRTFIVTPSPFAVDGLPVQVSVMDIDRMAEARPRVAEEIPELTDVRPPMPGRIIEIRVKLGDTVHRGQPLVVLEAMKMQNEIPSPTEGVVDAIRVDLGQSVDARQVLVTLRRG